MYFIFVVADSEAANRKTGNSKRPKGDDIGEGAALLLGFSNAKRPKGSVGPEITDSCKKDRDFEESAGLSTNDKDYVVRNPPLVLGGPQDEAWAWERSCHDGLLTYHDGRKRWYHCMYCQVCLFSAPSLRVNYFSHPLFFPVLQRPPLSQQDALRQNPREAG
jgi:hypothetical protein